MKNIKYLIFTVAIVFSMMLAAGCSDQNDDPKPKNRTPECQYAMEQYNGWMIEYLNYRCDGCGYDPTQIYLDNLMDSLKLQVNYHCN